MRAKFIGGSLDGQMRDDHPGTHFHIEPLRVPLPLATVDDYRNIDIDQVLHFKPRPSVYKRERYERQREWDRETETLTYKFVGVDP